MSGLELDAIWHTLKANTPDEDPLKADVSEYLAAGEWGIAAEAMAILSKRYKQDAEILPLLETAMLQLMAAEDEAET